MHHVAAALSTTTPFESIPQLQHTTKRFRKNGVGRTSTLDLQALHRVRDRLVSRQTSAINQLRAFLLERGALHHRITFRKGRLFLRKNMPAILEDAGCELSPRMQLIIHGLWQEWIAVESQIDEATGAMQQSRKSRNKKQDENCRRLLEVPGVGALVASAMVVAVGNGSAFARGREFSAWLAQRWISALRCNKCGSSRPVKATDD